jgi:tetratricopeptide (TPR) repeat protein
MPAVAAAANKFRVEQAFSLFPSAVRWLKPAACAFCGFLLLFSLGARADETASPAQLRYREGYRLLQEAERGPTAAERVTGLRAAERELRAALELDPRHYRARALLAQTAFGLAQELPDAAERRQAAAVARKEFAEAAQLEPEDWRIYNSWGRCLLFLANDKAAAPELLAEAKPLFEKARDLARWKSDNAIVNNLYGQCLYQLAELTPAGPDQRRYLEDCLAAYRTAMSELPVSTDPQAWRTLGFARLDLAQLTQNPALARDAGLALREALALDPAGVDLHFALARAAALLDEPEPALRYLRVCFESDTGTNWVERAAADPAFARLRERADVRDLLTTARHATQAAPHLQAGATLLARAGETGNLQHRRELLEQAADQFQRVARLQPAAALPYRLWGECLANLAQTADTPAAGRNWIRVAGERFAVAARLQPEPATYLAWGQALAYAAQHLDESPAQRAESLRNATAKLEEGLQLAGTAETRRAFDRELAGVLVLRAQGAEPLADRRNFAERAVTLCAALAPAKPSAEVRFLYQNWGLALLVAGQLNQDRLQLRQAVEKLTAALPFDPANAELHYRLATAYALLDSKPQALRHLRECLTGASGDAYRRRAADDRDLDALRSLPECNELIGGRPAAGAD